MYGWNGRIGNRVEIPDGTAAVLRVMSHLSVKAGHWGNLRRQSEVGQMGARRVESEDLLKGGMYPSSRDRGEQVQPN